MGTMGKLNLVILEVIHLDFSTLRRFGSFRVRLVIFLTKKRYIIHFTNNVEFFMENTGPNLKWNFLNLDQPRVRVS